MPGEPHCTPAGPWGLVAVQRPGDECPRFGHGASGLVVEPADASQVLNRAQQRKCPKGHKPEPQGTKTSFSVYAAPEVVLKSV